MDQYGQFCPLAKAAEVLCQRWTMLVVRELIAGSRRFNDLQRGLPQMSPTLLSRRLRSLEEVDVIERRTEGSHTVYCLTEAGRELQEVVEAMSTWGHRWVRSQLENDDLDAGLLMWDMRRSVDPEQFPQHRVVVQFHFPDADDGSRYWWLVSCDGETDLCLEDPGHEVDILLQASLAAMTAVWICEMTLDQAIKRGDVKLVGPAELRQQLPHWLQASALSRLGEQRSMEVGS